MPFTGNTVTSAIRIEQTRKFSKNYVSSTPPKTHYLPGNDLIAHPGDCMCVYTGVCQMYSLASQSRGQECGGEKDYILY